MRWPLWSSSKDKDDPPTSTDDNPNTLFTRFRNQYPTLSISTPDPPSSSPSSRSVSAAIDIPTALTTLLLGASLLFLRSRLRRYPTAPHIPHTLYHRRSLYGFVTSVGDGDGLRLFHTPGGRLLLWGTRFRPIPSVRKDLKDQTISVRLAGVDAPEGPHFGKIPQPGSREALDWLRVFVGGRWVRVEVFRRDQFERAVGRVWVRQGMWWRRRDVGREMLREGLAVVYEGNVGAEFGGKLGVYEKEEEGARERRVGVWRKKGKFVTPGEYKKQLRGAFFEQEVAGGGAIGSGSGSGNGNGNGAAAKKGVKAVVEKIVKKK